MILKIIYKKHKEEGNYWCKKKYSLITIKPGLKKNFEAEVLMHEFIHFLSRRYSRIVGKISEERTMKLGKYFVNVLQKKVLLNNMDLNNGTTKKIVQGGLFGVAMALIGFSWNLSNKIENNTAAFYRLASVQEQQSAHIVRLIENNNQLTERITDILIIIQKNEK